MDLCFGFVARASLSIFSYFNMLQKILGQYRLQRKHVQKFILKIFQFFSPSTYSNVHCGPLRHHIKSGVLVGVHVQAQIHNALGPLRCIGSCLYLPVGRQTTRHNACGPLRRHVSCVFICQLVDKHQDIMLGAHSGVILVVSGFSVDE